MSEALDAWLSYIYSLHSREIDLGLERILAIGQSLAVATFSCPVIVVGGTNGKGSVLRLLECIYGAAGYRVAAYTSPHLLRFNERLRINDREVEDAVWVGAFETIEKARGCQSLSFFEFTTLAALWISQQVSLDVLLLEVGLGGRLDAVNIVDADLAIISTVDIDHTDWLGLDRETIGREKAGILRARRPGVCGDSAPPQSLLQTAKILAAPLYCFTQDFIYEKSNKEGYWRWLGPHTQYDFPRPALKLQNAATSVMAIELLQPRLPVTTEAMTLGIAQASLPGRFEVVHEVVNIIYDVAHNPQSAGYLAEQLRDYAIKQGKGGQMRAVFSALKDKEVDGILAPFVGMIDYWYTATLPVPRGLASVEILRHLQALGMKNCYNFGSIQEAFQRAMKEAGSKDTVIVFGSFYTVAIAKQSLQNRALVH